MRTNLASCALACVLCACASRSPAVSTAPTNAPPDTTGITEITPPEGMRVYTMVLLRRGPEWTAESTPESRAVGEGHMAHIRRMAAAGKLKVAGPFLGQTDAGDLAGLYIFAITDLDEVRALTSMDPGVSTGRFIPEFLVWLGPDNLAPDIAAPEPCTGQASGGEM